jgi:hypothetical protein
MRYFIRGRQVTAAQYQNAIAEGAIGHRFGKLRTNLVPPAPTYKQAIVHMYREAQSILKQGEELKQKLFVARRNYFFSSGQLAGDRRMLAYVQKRKTFWHIRYEDAAASSATAVCCGLDALWAAQEAYQAWAREYGDV